MEPKQAGLIALIVSMLVIFLVTVLALTAGRNSYGTVTVAPGGPYLRIGPTPTATTATATTTTTAALPAATTAAPALPAAAPTPTPAATIAPAAVPVTTAVVSLNPLPASDFDLGQTALVPSDGIMITL